VPPFDSLLSRALDAIGPSIALDAGLHFAACAAAYAVARAIGCGRAAAAVAASVLATHPAAVAALAIDGRAVALASVAGLGAIAALRLPRALGLMTSSVLALLAAIAGAPAALGAAAILVCFPGDRPRARRWIGVATVVVAGLVHQGGMRVEPALRALALAILPFAPAPDLASGPIGAPDRIGLVAAGAWAALAVAAGILALTTRRDARTPLAPVLASIALAAAFVGLAATPPGRPWLDDRAPAALAPFVALAIGGLVEAAIRRLAVRAPSSIPRVAGAFVPVLAVAATAGALRFHDARDVEGYVFRAIERAPESTYLREARGRLLDARARKPGLRAAERAELFAEAGRDLRRTEPSDPSKRAQDLVDAAYAFGRARERDEALEALATADAIEPGSRDVRIARARVLEAVDDLDGALAEVIAAGDLGETLRLRARSLRPGADGSELDRDIAAAIAPGSPAELRASGYAARALVELRRGRAVEALADANEARRIDPACVEAYLAGVDVHRASGELEGAIAELEIGLQRARGSGDLLVALAGVELERGGEPARAIQLTDLARQVDPGARGLDAVAGAAHARDAEQRLQKGDVAGAEAAALEAVAEAPKLGRAHAALASVRDAQKRRDDAIASLERAFALDASAENRDRLAEAIRRRALAHRVRGDRDAAVDDLLRARGIAPSIDLGSGADLLREEAETAYRDGVAALASRDVSKAAARLERSLRLVPDNAFALGALGEIAASDGDDDRALDLWTRALDAARASKLDLAELPLLEQIARLHRRRGRNDLARQFAREYLALEKGPYRVRCEALLDAIDVLEKPDR